MSKTVRIIPLGGLGEIGKNMTAIQYENEIIIIDAGIMFPENDMLGIDYIIPDYEYLLDKVDQVKAILFTHGHEDHVGAVGHLMKQIKAPIYATPLTAGFIQVKLQRASVHKDIQINVIQAGDVFHIGSFTIEPFHMAHSIPDCVGFGITTPAGLIVHSGDYKFDHTPVDGWPPDFAKLAEFSQRGVLCLLADSTNAERPGWTPTELVVSEAFDEVFNEAKGRIIIASFASHISRIQQVANAAYQHGRKMAVSGRSMRDNIKMATNLGYLDLPPDLLIELDQAKKMPPSKIVVMVTGSQGEPTSVMGRLAYGRDHRLSILPGDSVILSAHTIPGNEETVTRIINRLFQKGAKVFYEGLTQVHVSGHASREEMKLLINLVRPKYFVPVHGELRHLTQHGRLAEELGIPAQNIAVVENGTVIEISSAGMNLGDRVPGGYVYVDGESVGDIGPKLMRDRERLGESGFFVAGVPIGKYGQLTGQPEYITRGILNFEEDFYATMTSNIESVVERHWQKPPEHLKQILEEAVSRVVYTQTGKRTTVGVILK
jgi:ribonuclease J